MAGIDDLIGSNALLRSLANAIGMKRDVQYPAEMENVPEAPTTGNQLYMDSSLYDLQKDPLRYLPRSTVPQDLPVSVQAYRGDPTGRYGGKDKLETLPISRVAVGGDRYHPREPDPQKSNVFNDSTKAVQELYRMARLNGSAQKHGYPAMTPEEIAAFFLKEGRTDLGYNVLSGGAKDTKYEQELLKLYSLPRRDTNFLATVAAKKRIADKLGVPFAQAWNGLGVNEAGQSGADYAKNWDAHLAAVNNPKNKALLDLIRRGIEDGKTYGFHERAKLEQDTKPKHKKEPYKSGGSVDKPLSGGHKVI